MRRPGGGRSLHQSSISLGHQTETTYSTTHSESFARRGCDGQPLIFQLDSCFPSQLGRVDPSHVPAGPSYTSTHSRDVHSPKDVTPQSVLHSLRTGNRTRNREGLAMKEVTNPPEDRSSCPEEHCGPASSSEPPGASGKPTNWHRHHILTGEAGAPAGPGGPRRGSRERLLWAARRWEAEAVPLRLY